MITIKIGHVSSNIRLFKTMKQKAMQLNLWLFSLVFYEFQVLVTRVELIVMSSVVKEKDKKAVEARDFRCKDTNSAIRRVN